MNEVTQSVEIANIIANLRHNVSSMLSDVSLLNGLPTRQGEPWFGISALEESAQLLDELRHELDRIEIKGSQMRSALASIYWLVRGGVYMSDDILSIAKAHLWPTQAPDREVSDRDPDAPRV